MGGRGGHQRSQSTRDCKISQSVGLSAKTGNGPGKAGHAVHPCGGWVCKMEQAQCEIQGKPLFKGNKRMLSRRGRQVSPDANFASHPSTAMQCQEPTFHTVPVGLSVPVGPLLSSHPAPAVGQTWQVLLIKPSLSLAHLCLCPGHVFRDGLPNTHARRASAPLRLLWTAVRVCISAAGEAGSWALLSPHTSQARSPGQGSHLASATHAARVKSGYCSSKSVKSLENSCYWL